MIAFIAEYWFVPAGILAAWVIMRGSDKYVIAKYEEKKKREAKRS